MSAARTVTVAAPLCADCGEPITFAGKPCGAGHIAAGKTCRIGSGPASVSDATIAGARAHQAEMLVGIPDRAGGIKTALAKRSPAEVKAIDAVDREVRRKWATPDPSDPEDPYGNSNAFEAGDACNWARNGYAGLMVVRRGGKLAGVMAVMEHKTTIEVRAVGADPKGAKGQGAAMLAHAARLASDRGKSLSLNPSEEAREFYRKMGMEAGKFSFTFTPEQAGAFADQILGPRERGLSASGVVAPFPTDDGADLYVWHAGDLVWQTTTTADRSADLYVWHTGDVEWLPADGDATPPPCMYCGEPVDLAGKPCGNSFISPGLTCRIGGSRGFVDETDWAGYWQGQPTTKPSTAERNALVDYGSEAYTGVNAALRAGGKMTAKEKRIAAGLDSYIERAEPLAEDVVVYRGGRLPPGLKVGSTLKDDAYMSTTGDAQAAGAFARDPSALFQIKVPKGTKAAVMGAALGGQDFESEMVLARGTRLRVTGTDKVKLPYRKIQGGIGWRTQKVMVLEVVP